MNIFLNKTSVPKLYTYKPLEECLKIIDKQTDKFIADIETIDNTEEYKQKAIVEVKRLGEDNKAHMTKLMNKRGVYA